MINWAYLRSSKMSYQHILVPVDGSEISYSAVRHAASIAKAFQSKLTLISLVVEDPFVSVDFYYTSAMMKEYFVEAYSNAKKALAEAQKLSLDEYEIDAETHIIKGLVSGEQIADAANEYQVDLVVMGSHGRTGLKKLFLGSFAQDVLQHVHLPVMIVKQ